MALLLPRADAYRTAHPQPEDVFLLIEVADASLEHDRDAKVPLYAAAGVPERELVAGFDSVSACLSKGLGAPVGSLIAGRRDFIRRCLKLRKMWGGGMRQAGILAAAGLHALDHHRARLRDDHANARALAERLAGARHVRVDPASVQTNMVLIDLDRGTAAAVAERARESGVLLGPFGARRIRAVTHLDVDRAGVMRAGDVIADIAASL